jgi:zinc-ribbon domain
VKQDTASSKKCPMCGTKNDPNAEVCKNCGYIFEDFSSPGISAPPTASAYRPQEEQQSPSSFGTFPAASQADNFPSPSSSMTSTGSPLFTVSKSLVSVVGPLVFYVAIIFFLTAGAGLSDYSLGLILIFALIFVLPVLFSPRKYEFYDSSLRIHKTLGGDTEIEYSDLEIYDYPVRGRARIVLVAQGQRRPIMISGDPVNSVLGQSLSEFLGKRLKKYSARSKEQEQSAPSSDTDTGTGSDESQDLDASPENDLSEQGP